MDNLLCKYSKIFLAYTPKMFNSVPICDYLTDSKRCRKVGWKTMMKIFPDLCFSLP